MRLIFKQALLLTEATAREKGDSVDATEALGVADMQKRKVPGCLALAKETSNFSTHVENWMNAILGDINFSITTDYIKAITDIRYGNSREIVA